MEDERDSLNLGNFTARIIEWKSKNEMFFFLSIFVLFFCFQYSFNIYKFVDVKSTIKDCGTNLFFSGIVFFLVDFLGPFSKGFKSIPLVIKNTIETSLSSMRMYTAGIHRGNIEGILHLMNEDVYAEHFNEGNNDGTLIIRPKTSIPEYSRICDSFLAKATKSVFSMSDMEMDETMRVFYNTQSGVDKWITDVNQRATSDTENKIKCTRIQILTSERISFVRKMTSNNLKDSDISELTKIKIKRNASGADCLSVMKEGFSNYESHYKNNNDVIWKGYQIDVEESQQEKLLIRGEYIIFDEKVLVRYDQDALLLEVLVGDTVKAFSTVFGDDITNKMQNDFPA